MASGVGPAVGVLILSLVLGGGALYVWRVPLLMWVGARLVHADVLRPGDAIVVLGGGSAARDLAAADCTQMGTRQRSS